VFRKKSTENKRMTYDNMVFR